MSGQAGLAPEPPPMPGLDALLLASLQDCPDAILVRDDGEALSGRAFADLVQAAASQFRRCGLKPGERVLLAMGFDVASLVALVGALRAGLGPALVPCGLRPMELATQAAAAEAVALVGPTGCGDAEFGETYLTAASLSEAIRLVATLGPNLVDGAVDLSLAALRAAPSGTESFGAEASTILTFAPGSTAPVAHRQAGLFAAALALVDQAGINPSRPLLSTILPATLAGLVAGPFAALIGASSFALHGPFAAAAFLRAQDAEPGTHLVVPAAMGPLLQDAGMIGDGGALILLSRFATPAAYQEPVPLRGERPVVDFIAFGEAEVAARSREGGSTGASDLPVASGRGKAAAG